jgi:hypothetical protein
MDRPTFARSWRCTGCVWARAQRMIAERPRVPRGRRAPRCGCALAADVCSTHDDDSFRHVHVHVYPHATTEQLAFDARYAHARTRSLRAKASVVAHLWREFTEHTLCEVMAHRGDPGALSPLAYARRANRPSRARTSPGRWIVLSAALGALHGLQRARQAPEQNTARTCVPSWSRRSRRRAHGRDDRRHFSSTVHRGARSSASLVVRTRSG